MLLYNCNYHLFLVYLIERLSVTLTPHIHLSQPIEVSSRSFYSLAMFRCHVTYNYTLNYCIILFNYRTTRIIK